MAFENSPVFLMPSLRERALAGPTATNSPMLFPLAGGSGAVIKLGELVMILDLHRQGLSVSAIARHLCIDRKTVRSAIAKGLEPPKYKTRPPRARITDPFEPYLKERLAAYPGLTAVRLWREVKERGYAGGYSVLRDCARPAAAAHHRFRSALRKAAWRASASRLRPFRGEVCRRSRRQARRLAVFHGARLLPAYLGPLRRSPGPAERPALSYRRSRGDRRCAA